jgi:hypothetical protein
MYSKTSWTALAGLQEPASRKSEAPIHADPSSGRNARCGGVELQDGPCGQVDCEASTEGDAASPDQLLAEASLEMAKEPLRHRKIAGRSLDIISIAME